MATFKDLAPLPERYGYDANHNLRYLSLAKLINERNIKELLILGCGKGILEYVLPDDIKCLSVDINPEDVNIARTINSNKKNRKFIAADIIDFMEKSGKKFEAVLISEVLEELQDDNKALALVHKMIKPNGLFFLTVPNIDRLINNVYSIVGREKKFMAAVHLREYTTDGIFDMLKRLSFKILHTEYVYLGFPKEDVIRKLVPVDSILRSFLLKLYPRWGTYITIISSLPDRQAGIFNKYLQSYEKKRIQLIGSIYNSVPFSKDWRVADVGAGIGIFADIIKPHVSAVVCLDISPSDVEACAKKGYDSLCSNLDKGLPFKGSEFDFVNTLETIEHITDPGFFLDEVKRVLKKDGFLLISTLNRNSPEGLKGKIIETITKKRWNGWDPSHKHLFTYDEFLTMIKERFEVVDVRGYYFGFLIFKRHMPFFLWGLATRIGIFKRFAFDIIVLAKNSKIGE